MQYKHLNTDFKSRIQLKKIDINNFIWHFLKKNSYLSKKKQNKLANILFKNSTTRKSTLKNICLETGLKRSVLSSFSISRHVFRKKAANLFYPGIRKSCW